MIKDNTGLEAKLIMTDTFIDNLTDNTGTEEVKFKLAVNYWNKCLEFIRDNVSKQVFKTWFEPVKAIKLENNMLTVQVPSQFFYEWIEEHYYSLLQKTINKILGPEARLQYEVIVDEGDDTLESRTIKVPAFKNQPVTQPSLAFGKNTKEIDFKTNLNNRYSFENFVIGESNQFASSAALAVAKNPGGTKYNPLVIYGNTGLGKTHLIQAIGNYVVRNNSIAKVFYTTSDEFTSEFVNAIQNNKLSEFINYYRSVDVLIVDDIQFFAGKEKTQDNFFHTFNALHQAGKQLVLTSDKPPRELQDVDERLISRFQWGLITDIQQPDLEMRMAIIQKKSNDEGIELPMEIVEYLARNIKSSIREIEGALITLIAMVTFDKRKITLELAKEVVEGLIKPKNTTITIDYIKEIVADYYNLTCEQIASKSRKQEIALARQMAMYLAKKYTQCSLKTIGSYFGNRDHSTVLHSCQTIEGYISVDSMVRTAYEILCKRLNGEF